MTVDLRRNSGTELTLIYVNSDCVRRVQTFIAEDLTWIANTKEVVKKARQRLHFLGILGK